MPKAHGAICFASQQALPPAVLPALRLATRHQEALAKLLPLLLCGEESAALVFARFARDSALSSCARGELKRIGEDERCHERELQALRQALPQVPVDDNVDRQTRRFFVRLAGEDLGTRFARIAALDSGVCEILGAVRARGLPLRQDAAVCGILARIHQDESRHVVVSRRYARLLLDRHQAYTVAAEMREQLATLMTLRCAALADLGADPERLLARLRRVPRRLLA